MGRSKKKNAKEAGQKELFEPGAERAAELLLEIINNQDVKLETRLDCAKEVLNRVYGKPGAAAAETEKGNMQITLEKEAAKLAE